MSRVRKGKASTHNYLHDFLIFNSLIQINVKAYKSNGPVHLALDKNNLDVITTFARVGGVECLRVQNQNGVSVLERLTENENFGDIFKCGLYRYIQKVNIIKSSNITHAAPSLILQIILAGAGNE